ncbi:MAG TPA: RNA-binding S4 domain-containing protein [Firmicutes bacterium]|nr:RNA-binding S4 domain-containing protein [Bacillota bacterium]
MKEIEIFTGTIKLDQFLKWAGVALTGGEAKRIVTGGFVKVNGVLEQRRGRTLVPGDIVDVSGFGSFCLMRRAKL